MQSPHRVNMDSLTHTKRAAFKNCRRFYWHRHECRLQTRVRRPGLRRGAAFADALEAAAAGYAEGGLEAAAVAASDAVARVYSAAVERALSQQEADELALEEVAVSCLSRRYLDVYGIDDRREVEYSSPLVNPASGRVSRSFRLAGRIDGVTSTGDRRVRVIEDKLVQRVDAVSIARLALDDQITEYVDAFAARGWSCDVAYRFTRYPGIKQRKDETREGFADRLRLDIDSRLGFYFQEHVLFFPTAHLADYRIGRWQVGQDILLARREGRWYTNPSRCWEYGGCEFIPLCTGADGAADLYEVMGERPTDVEEDDDGSKSA